MELLTRRFSFILISLLLISGAYSDITFYTNDGALTFEVAQLLIEYIGSLAEPIVNYTSIYIPEVNDNINITGLVVVTPTVNPIEPTIRKLQQQGAIAVILAQDSIRKYRINISKLKTRALTSAAFDIYVSCPVHPGRSFLETDGSEGRGIHIPAFEIGSVPTAMLSTIYTTDQPYVLVSIESTGNYWLVIVDKHIDVAFSVVVGLGAAFCVGFAIYKIVLFSKARGKATLEGIPQTCLALHLVANLIRLVYMTVDPLGIRHIITYYADNIMFTISFPITIVASLLMSLYWVEAMTSASLTVYPGLKKMKKPFIIFSILLGVLEITCGILRSTEVAGAGITFEITAVVYCILMVAMAIFYMIVSIVLLRRMKRSEAVSKRTKSLKITTWLIIGSVICFWICVVSLVIFLFPEVSGSVPGFLAIYFLGELSFVGVSMFQILVFNPRAIKGSHSSATAKKSGTDSGTVASPRSGQTMSEV